VTIDDMAEPEDLFRRQEALRAEADVVHDDLDLRRLEALGRPIMVGSAALGLMVRRDLDITVVCPSLDETVADAVAQLGAGLARHPRVRIVTIRDDTGDWNVGPLYPDGLYLGVTYRSSGGRDWTIDLWFVDEPDRQPDLAHLRDLPEQLTPETRLAILTIKQTYVDEGMAVSGHEVYTAVLEHGVRDRDEFDRWRQGPGS
jgi:hypothetical protein